MSVTSTPSTRTFPLIGKKEKVVLEHTTTSICNKPYKVKRLVNRVEPEIGTRLSKEAVQELMNHFNPNLSVEIV